MQSLALENMRLRITPFFREENAHSGFGNVLVLGIFRWKKMQTKERKLMADQPIPVAEPQPPVEPKPPSPAQSEDPVLIALQKDIHGMRRQLAHLNRPKKVSEPAAPAVSSSVASATPVFDSHFRNWRKHGSK